MTNVQRSDGLQKMDATNRPQGNSPKREILKEAFSIFDTNKDGRLSGDEMKNMEEKHSQNAIEKGIKAMVHAREEAIKKDGLQETNCENWLKDSNGNHYRYDSKTKKFVKVPNVEFVAKDGSYRTVNGKAQKVVHGHDGTLKVLNYQNKVYTNPDYAAEVAGLKKDGMCYTDSEGKDYIWDKKSHVFRDAHMKAING